MDRRAIAITGIVQGVGFRPYVYGLATRLRLGGFIKNLTGAVLIEVEGEAPALDRFLAELTTRPPPLARIEEVRWSPRRPLGDPAFQIESSAAEAEADGPIYLSPDVATCDECLAELFDPRDRRSRYPFLNCTNCGPRLTIITGAPYDRARTTMASFVMCPACRAEYDDPADRRFHAQPTACPACGPRLQALDARGEPVATDDPIAFAASALRRGMIGALKGLGGYHLACASDQSQAVTELRRRKHRDEKPFALMVRDLAAARELCAVEPAEEALLYSPRRPIVLLRRLPGARVAEDVAPGNPWLGVMLPYTPLHHLLLDALEGEPLVMTSGNRSDEPIAFEDQDALRRLAGIADFFLVHDRPIHIRCDDSVTRVVAGVELPIRRARGDAPRPVTLPVECRRPILALGGQQKVTFALGRGRHAFLSHHIGDLDHYEAERAYVEAIDHYERIFGLRPEILVHDLHPDYASNRYVREHAGSRATLAVQHHHAHMASCMAEHGLNEPVIGVTFDGTGFGADGTIWGGEFLTGDYRAFRRSAHLRPVAMPGGERAIREPWRMAAAYLSDAGHDCAILAACVPPATLATIERMIARRINAPTTSSAGRLFDAVAALAGVRPFVSYEGQAAIELEWRAATAAPDGVYPFEITEIADDAPLQIDTPAASSSCRTRGGATGALCGGDRPAVSLDDRGSDCASVCPFASELPPGCGGAERRRFLLERAAFTGEVAARLTGDGFRVYRQRRVPPNDGGLSLGQIAIAAGARKRP